jgi:hypothetical protein
MALPNPCELACSVIGRHLELSAIGGVLIFLNIP